MSISLIFFAILFPKRQLKKNNSRSRRYFLLPTKTKKFKPFRHSLQAAAFFKRVKESWEPFSLQNAKFKSVCGRMSRDGTKAGEGRGDRRKGPLSLSAAAGLTAATFPSPFFLLSYPFSWSFYCSGQLIYLKRWRPINLTLSFGPIFHTLIETECLKRNWRADHM